jgi:hypothetical protein
MGSFITNIVSSDMLSEEEDEAIAGREVGSAPDSVVGMVRIVPDDSPVGTDSVSESDPPAEKLQASETSRGKMMARIGILELCDMVTPYKGK